MHLQERAQRFACGCIPKLDAPAVYDRDHLAVMTDLEGLRAELIMRRRLAVPLGCHIPHPYPIKCDREERFAVMAPGDSIQCVVVLQRISPSVTRRAVPESDGLVPACRGERFAVGAPC